MTNGSPAGPKRITLYYLLYLNFKKAIGINCRLKTEENQELIIISSQHVIQTKSSCHLVSIMKTNEVGTLLEALFNYKSTLATKRVELILL